MDCEESEVCMRVADKLVQWAFAIVSMTEDGDTIFESVVGVRQSIVDFIEHTLRSSRGCPGICIPETQLLFFLENGFTIKIVVHPRGPRKHCVISAYIFNEKSRVRLGTK